jgi:hypothetical protein
MGIKWTIATICRDRSGRYLGVSVLAVPGISDLATLEAIACRDSLTLDADLYLQRTHIASDYLKVINTISKPSKCSFNSVISEISERKQFLEVQFVHEKRVECSRK